MDLSRPELERTLSVVSGKYTHVRCYGLFGKYDDGLAWLKKPQTVARPKCILSLGSSIGNFTRSEAVDFLKGFAGVLGAKDTMLIGLDACQDSSRVFHAYNDREGKTHEFVLNGLLHANRLMGRDIFSKEDWKVIGEYDVQAGRHQAFYSPVRDIQVEGNLMKAGERIRVEESYKYSLLQSDELWRSAGLTLRARFRNHRNDYREFLNPPRHPHQPLNVLRPKSSFLYC